MIFCHLRSWDWSDRFCQVNKLRIISNIISYHFTLSHILSASHEEPILESIFTSTPTVMKTPGWNHARSHQHHFVPRWERLPELFAPQKSVGYFCKFWWFYVMILFFVFLKVGCCFGYPHVPPIAMILSQDSTTSCSSTAVVMLSCDDWGLRTGLEKLWEGYGITRERNLAKGLIWTMTDSYPITCRFSSIPSGEGFLSSVGRVAWHQQQWRHFLYPRNRILSYHEVEFARYWHFFWIYTP